MHSPEFRCRLLLLLFVLLLPWAAHAQTVPVNGNLNVSGTVAGAMRDTGGQVFNVRAYGALGNGSTDDAAAIQTTIEAARSAGGGIVYFPRGRYAISTALTLVNTASVDYGGIQFRGTGWYAGSTPASNIGSWIEYTAGTGTALQLWGQSGSGGAGTVLNDVLMQGLGIAGTNSAYNGTLVDLRTSSHVRFVEMMFMGPEVTTPLTTALLSGDEWVATTCHDCFFRNALAGIKHVALGLPGGSFANSTLIHRGNFNRLSIPIDMQTSQQVTTVSSSIFEPSPAGTPATVKLGGSDARLLDSWFGDSNDTGTWIEMSGDVGQVVGNYISHAAIGLNLLTGSSRYHVMGNTLSNNVTAIQDNATSGTMIEANAIFVNVNGFGIDVANNTDGTIRDNRVDGAAGSTGYRLGTGTKGELIAPVDGTTPTVLTDNSTNGWSIRRTGVSTLPGGLQISSNASTFPDNWNSNQKLTGTSPTLWWHQNNSNDGTLIGQNGGALYVFREVAGVVPGNGYLMTLSANGMSLNAGATPNPSGAGLVLGTGALVLGTGEATGALAGNTVRGPNAVGTNIAGVTTTVQASLGTGTGALGTLDMTSAALGTASGATVHTAVRRATFGATKILTNNSAIAIESAALSNGSVHASQYHYAIEVTNGTDYQVEEGMISCHATNKTGTIANNTCLKSGNQQAMTSGTLTVTFAISAANPAVVSVNANSSLTPSAGFPRLTYMPFNLTQQALTRQ